jgi:hypothetical protein
MYLFLLKREHSVRRRPLWLYCGTRLQYSSLLTDITDSRHLVLAIGYGARGTEPAFTDLGQGEPLW